MVGVPRIDEEMVEECVRLGFEREALLESLRQRLANKASVTYYLLCDNRCGRAGRGAGRGVRACACVRAWTFACECVWLAVWWGRCKPHVLLRMRRRVRVRGVAGRWG